MQSPDTQNLLCDIGMPIIHRNSRYNCRVFLWNGQILLIRPKMHMADDGNYRESRWFNPWIRAGHTEEHALPPFMHHVQRYAPFGDAVLEFEDTKVAAEICEELFAPMSPHLPLAISGNVEIFLNGSASHHELNKLARRFELILGATSKVGGLYLYANQMGCDGDRLYFDGSAIISLNGQLLAQSPQFSPKHVHVVTATVDLDLIQILRGNRPSFTNQAAASSRVFPFEYANIRVGDVRLCWPSGLSSQLPITSPVIQPRYHAPAEEISLGPALWMWDYMRKSGASGLFLPLSGGLDSCACALIVYCMAKSVIEHAGTDEIVRGDLMNVLGIQDASALPKDASELMQRILHTAYLGTAYSSQSSRERAEKLARAINA